MRTLIYVPIVHSEADLGSMAPQMRRRFQETFGADAWARRHASVEDMWDRLRTKVCAEPIPWISARLYQDGLPVCGLEREIVRDLAATGSRNHQLLLDLIERGATLVGTEHPELIVQEYARIQRLVEASQDRAADSVVTALKCEGEALLAARDAFIARRIDSTLREGETGLLFLGLLHRVDEHLDRDVEVNRLIHDLPFGAATWPQLRERCGRED